MDRRKLLEHTITRARAVLKAEQRGSSEPCAEDILWCALKHALSVGARTTGHPGPRPTGNWSPIPADDPASSMEIAGAEALVDEVRDILAPTGADPMRRRNWIVLHDIADGKSMQQVADRSPALHMKLRMVNANKLTKQRVGQIKWEALAKLATRLRARLNLVDFLLRNEIAEQPVKDNRKRKKPCKTGRILHPNPA